MCSVLFNLDRLIWIAKIYLFVCMGKWVNEYKKWILELETKHSYDEMTVGNNNIGQKILLFFILKSDSLDVTFLDSILASYLRYPQMLLVYKVE